VIVSASTSVACSVSEKGVGEPSSLIVTEELSPSVMTGASLAAVIVTFTVMEAVSAPSETVTTKLSLPFLSGSGV
jgi:hypothetical protein